jgi:hypothetical protein
MNIIKNKPEIGKMDWRLRKITLRSYDEIRFKVPAYFNDPAIQTLYDDFLLPDWVAEALSGEKNDNRNLATLEHLGIVTRLREAIHNKLEKRFGKDNIPYNLLVEIEPTPWSVTKDNADANRYYFHFRLVMKKNRPFERVDLPSCIYHSFNL